jgi:hypothetical protein
MFLSTYRLYQPYIILNANDGLKNRLEKPNFHNRRQALALPAETKPTSLLPEGQNFID